MKPYISSRLMEHAPGAPCPVPPDTPVWVLTVGNSGPFCIRAGRINWANASDMLEDIVLAWAPVVEPQETKSTQTVTAPARLIEGDNRLSLCPATMIAVVQAWLDEEIASPVEVRSVEYASGVNRFEVRFERKKETQG